MNPSSPSRQNDTHGKALSLNLEATTYGTLAEIGAGQEVARWFLSVGAASGTVAKTISAYDKTVSDNVYGAGTRYVSKERLLAMLEHEYGLLLDRLNPGLGRNKRFFVFADTVAARNYQGTNEQHGWLGIRFQTEPRSEPSQILLHINLRDSTALLQQQAVGILGVNLIHGAFHRRSDSRTFLSALFDELTIARIEIDVLEISGPAFSDQDAHTWCLALLQRHMAHAIVFDTAGHVVEPSSVLRKRPLLVMRGSFTRPELFDQLLYEAGLRQLLSEGVTLERKPGTLMEMTIHSASRVEGLAESEMVQCVRGLVARGPVMITDYPETYLVSQYLRRHTTAPVRFILGVSTAAKTMDEAFYQALPGTLLEGVGRLLAANIKLYVAPMPFPAFEAAVQALPGTITKRAQEGGWVTLGDLTPAGPVRHLFEYLLASGRIVALE